jgi:hypothetical protein
MDDADFFDLDLEVWDQLVCAVRWLRRSNARPEITLRLASKRPSPAGSPSKPRCTTATNRSRPHRHDAAGPA